MQSERLNGWRDAESAQRAHQGQLHLSPWPQVRRFNLQVGNRLSPGDERFHHRALARAIRTHQRDETSPAPCGGACVGSNHQMSRDVARLRPHGGPEHPPAQPCRSLGLHLVPLDPRRGCLERRSQAKRVKMIVEIALIDRRLQKMPDPLKRSCTQRPLPKEMMDDEVNQLIFRRQVKHPVRFDSPRQHALRVHVDDAVLRRLPMNVQTHQLPMLIAQHDQLERTSTWPGHEPALFQQVAEPINPRLVDQHVEIAGRRFRFATRPKQAVRNARCM